MYSFSSLLFHVQFSLFLPDLHTEFSRGRSLVSTVLFDNDCEVIHDRVDIQKIQPMTGKEYYVRGCTALLDAVGGAIHHIGNVHKYAREEDRPEKTLFVITTDGILSDASKSDLNRLQP